MPKAGELSSDTSASIPAFQRHFSASSKSYAHGHSAFHQN